MNNRVKKLSVMLMVLLLSSCTGVKEDQTATNLALDRYLGTWYEIARLDHSFERGMEQVTTSYSLHDDGEINVVNRGFSLPDNEWKDAQGKAYFIDNSGNGYLKVSLFSPAYGAYVIFELEQENYQYAFISCPNLDYLWLLSRTPEVAPEVIDQFISVSETRGFDTSQLIFVNH